ncbi:hypothetical protein Tco_1215104 [Tanacetum coccineum]
MFDTLLPFLSENDDKVFNPGILASNEEKSPHLLSYRGFKAFQHFYKTPLMIYGGDIPILDVPIAPGYEAFRTRELNYDDVIKSFSPSPIPVEGNDFLMEEIGIFLTPDDSMPPGIENDDYDSEWDILFLEELISNDSPSLPENESFHFDVPSSLRPPAKPMEFTLSPIRDF